MTTPSNTHFRMISLVAVLVALALFVATGVIVD
jgi:hypothetical protein